MNLNAHARPVASAHPWWLVLGLIGVDYFSTLAYLPSIAVASAGAWAPWAALLVVLVTLFIALPVYSYVLGRSPHGQGATGLIDRNVAGWRGKLLILILMGFVAADFVVTRSLSLADAAVHVNHNSHWAALVDQFVPSADRLKEHLGADLARWLAPYWNRQIGVTLALMGLAVLFWLLLARGFTRRVLWLGTIITVLYLALNALLLGGLLIHLSAHPDLLQRWWNEFPTLPHNGAASLRWEGISFALIALVILSFPQMALGISGYELSMSLTPLVHGADDDDPDVPRARIRKTRRLLLIAALIMAVFMCVSVLLTTLLVPPAAMDGEGVATHRALSYLAHGGLLTTGERADQWWPLLGDVFGTVYDLSTIVILCLAGVSVMISLRDLVPKYLHRMGMELSWAVRFSIIVQVFNVIILLVTFVFKASVSAQEWAYSTSVQVLLTGAALAALLDLWKRAPNRWLKPLIALPALLAVLFFLGTTLLTVWQNWSGVVIAGCFVAALLFSSFVSRWMRSMELRFQGFTFADSAAMHRWEEICRLNFQVLVPHRPGMYPLAQKNEEIRKKHRVPPDAHLIFIQVEIGDPSDFTNKPLMRIVQEDGLEVIRIERAVSIAHTIAAIGLEFRRVGQPPEIIFGWSQESPLAANLNFLLLGEGNVPWMVQQLVHKAEPDEARRPRIVIG